MKKLIRKTFILSLFLFPLSPLFSQVLSKKDFIKSVQSADISFYYDEDYEKAASLYLILHNSAPNNANIAAKLGISYLNVDGMKNEALKHLLEASANIVKTEKEYVEYGEKAPLDTYLYLAIAYHKNDSLQKAIKLYNDAKRRLAGTEIFRVDYIDKQIRDCRYAIEMEKKPIAITSSLFAPWLKEFPGALNPVLSENDSVFVFTLKKDGQTSIWCSYKSDHWKRPVDITKQLGGYDRFYSNSITGDGKLLIIYMDDGDDGNLHFSQRKDSTWTRIRTLGKNINSIYWESHGFITPDGKTLYFTSNRPGGSGDLDIWVADKDASGAWNRPLNLGNVINTPYNEFTPFFDPSSNSLLFSSEGNSSMGGYDVFRSIKRNGTWTKPIGLSYGYNNTLDNTFFTILSGNQGYLTSLYQEKNGTRNIYSLLSADTTNKTIRAEGTISLNDGIGVDPSQTKIQLFDQKTGSLLKNISVIDSASFNLVMKPGKFKVIISRIGSKADTINLNVRKEKPEEPKSLTDTALFKFEIKPGDYQLFINHIGYKTDTINLNIPSRYSGTYISLNSSLIPDKVFSGDFLDIKNLLFDYDSYKLTEKALLSLEILKSILINYPDLKIEVAGYTDSRGTDEYNRNLADKRAQTIINYLSSFEIAKNRFSKKAIGNSDFVALNTHSDGSDNPEGRKYNRRVTIGIINPQTGVTLHQETYTPDHLRQPSSVKYSIVLLKTNSNVASDYFSRLAIDEFHMIRSTDIDSLTIYFIGIFYNKNDATKYLIYARQKGFKDAYIVTQSEINKSSESVIRSESDTEGLTREKIYTIQLAASKVMLNMNQFKNIEGVREITSPDGYYRYYYGEYNSFSSAKAALAPLIEAGYKDVFIKELNVLIKQ